MLDFQSVLLMTLIVPISYIILAILMGKRRISKIFDVFLNALELYISIDKSGTYTNNTSKSNMIKTACFFMYCSL